MPLEQPGLRGRCRSIWPRGGRWQRLSAPTVHGEHKESSLPALSLPPPCLSGFHFSKKPPESRGEAVRALRWARCAR